MIKLRLNIFTVLTLFIASSIFVSCSDEDNEVLPESNIENSLKYQNKLFVANLQGSISKYENDILKYNIVVENSNLATIESREENSENELIIRNNETNEYIEILNVQEHENYYTFDLVNNLGARANDFTFYGEMFQDDVASRCPPCIVGIIAVIVGAAVELLSIVL